MGVFNGIMTIGENCSFAIYGCNLLHLCNNNLHRVKLDWESATTSRSGGYVVGLSKGSGHDLQRVADI